MTKDRQGLPFAKERRSNDHQAVIQDFDPRHAGVLPDENLCTTNNHLWLLDVCDDLIEYCEANDLENSASELRHVLVALVDDMERPPLPLSALCV